MPETHFRVDSQRSYLGELELFTGSSAELVDKIHKLTQEQRPQLVVTPNVDQVIDLDSHIGLRVAYEKSVMRVIDGMPIVGLLRFLGMKNVERHTGADLLPMCAAVSGSMQWRVVVLGGKREVAERAVENLRREFQGSHIEYVDFPYIADVSDVRSASVIADLVRKAPDIVFLCMGSPKQETWFTHWEHKLPAAVYIGAGAAVDFAAGQVKRAPIPFQKIGLEWIWRLMLEPKRLGHRYLIKGPRFVPIIISSLKRKAT